MVAMMNSLYGKANINTFLGTWEPLMHTVATKGTIFKWERILASSPKSHVQASKNPTKGEQSKFYMASYLLDTICAKCDFEGLGLKWTPEEKEPVHIHYKRFWNRGCKGMYERIAESFISPLNSVLFREEPPCMPERARKSLHNIVDWFPIGEETYIKVFGAYKPPHALPCW